MNCYETLKSMQTILGEIEMSFLGLDLTRECMEMNYTLNSVFDYDIYVNKTLLKITRI